MADKVNCWEFKKCGRQPGGEKTRELGICPVASNEEYDGVHDGKNAGRVCWIVSASLCGGKKQSDFSGKFYKCKECEFFLLVKKEEGRSSSGFAQTPLGAQNYITIKRKHESSNK